MIRCLRRLTFLKLGTKRRILPLFLLIIIYISLTNFYHDKISELCCPQNEDFMLAASKNNTIDLKNQKTKVKKSSHTFLKYSSSDDWIEVDGTERDLFIYSAYYDERQRPAVVRVISIVKRMSKKFSCQVWTTNGNKYDGKVLIKLIRENWGLKYSAAFLICKDFRLKHGEIAEAITIKTQKNASSETRIKIMHFPSTGYEGNFSVCVKPFHYEYNRAVWLVEFIELHRILGVRKFFFYNHTVGEELEKALQYYIKEGLVEVFQWSLPVITQKEIRTEGIFASLNDCNLRNVGRYRFTFMIDLDEFIIPRDANNYHELFADLGEEHSSYVFQNVFFYLYWNNDTTASNLLYGTPNSIGTKLYGNESEGPYLLTAYKTTRLSVPHKHNTRSKYVVQPERVIECGNHFAWESIGEKSVLNVGHDIALSHHYRICEYGGFDCLKSPHLVYK
ncbi:hypothetical protein Avbf_11618 [Armadillidium vulgare]|nr:hypothetical protein Avbf_11618 [Armadillidium vulgare]